MCKETFNNILAWVQISYVHTCSPRVFMQKQTSPESENPQKIILYHPSAPAGTPMDNVRIGEFTVGSTAAGRFRSRAKNHRDQQPVPFLSEGHLLLESIESHFSTLTIPNPHRSWSLKSGVLINYMKLCYCLEYLQNIHSCSITNKDFVTCSGHTIYLPLKQWRISHVCPAIVKEIKTERGCTGAALPSLKPSKELQALIALRITPLSNRDPK